MSRPGFTFLICPDSELTKARLDELLAGQGTFERKVYWGDEELPSAFWQDLTVPSLLGSARAVVLRRANTLPADSWHKLATVLRGFNSQIWPFFCLEGEWDKNQPKVPKWITKQPYWTVAEQRGWIWRSQGLVGDGLAKYLKAWAVSRGLVFEPEALQAFASILPRDARAVSLEMDKIELGLAGRKRIGLEDLELVSFHAETRIFDLLKLIAAGKGVEVWGKLLDSEAGSEELVFAFLALLLRDARDMWRLLHGEPAGSPYGRQDRENMARRLGAAGLTRIFELAMEAEFDVKSGRMKPNQAMDSLVAGLFRLFTPRSFAV